MVLVRVGPRQRVGLLRDRSEDGPLARQAELRLVVALFLQSADLFAASRPRREAATGARSPSSGRCVACCIDRRRKSRSRRRRTRSPGSNGWKRCRPITTSWPTTPIPLRPTTNPTAGSSATITSRSSSSCPRAAAARRQSRGRRRDKRGSSGFRCKTRLSVGPASRAGRWKSGWSCPARLAGPTRLHLKPEEP